VQFQQGGISLGLKIFLSHVDRLDKTPRRGWRRRGIEEPESVMAHSFRVAVLALLFKDSLGLDGERLLSMALVHDLAEAVCGDITPFDSVSRKRDLEEASMREIVGELTPEQGDKIISLWREYEEGESREARVVKEMDKMDMAFKAWVYKNEGYEVGEFRKEAERVVRSKDLRDLLDEF